MQRNNAIIFSLMKISVFIWIVTFHPGCDTDGETGNHQDAGSEEIFDVLEDAPEESPADRHEDSSDMESESSGDEPAATCEPMTDRSCIMLKRGESEYFKFLDNYETMEFDDEGTIRTVVMLWELVDEEIAPQPNEFRYKIFGTDGYSHSDYLYWENFLGGYIEIGTRKVVFEVEQELPHLYRVKDAYLIVLFPY